MGPRRHGVGGVVQLKTDCLRGTSITTTSEDLKTRGVCGFVKLVRFVELAEIADFEKCVELAELVKIVKRESL